VRAVVDLWEMSAMGYRDARKKLRHKFLLFNRPDSYGSELLKRLIG
jgi:hypothetical protein